MQTFYIKPAVQFMLCLMVGQVSMAQLKIGIQPGLPPSSAMLEVDGGTNRGLLLPRLTTVQLNNIANPVAGLMAYATDIQAIMYHNGTKWMEVKEPQPGFSLPHTGVYVNNNAAVLQVTNNGTSGPAITGTGSEGPGVYGSSLENTGIRAQTSNGFGLHATAGTGTALYARSESGTAVSLTHGSATGRALFVDQGRVGIGTLNPLAKLHVTDDDVVFTGSAGELTLTPVPVEGAGRRFMWLNNRVALRAGRVTNTQWNTVSTGQYSVGLGLNTQAFQSGTVVLGNNLVASGNGAVVLGRDINASGSHAFAAGSFSGPNGVSGNGAIFIGRFQSVAGDNAIAIGVTGNANGEFATKIGYETVAGNLKSIAIGSFAQSNGTAALALGHQASALQVYSLALGHLATASGAFSTAIGYNAAAAELSSTAIGNDVVAAANGSVSIGANETQTNGNHSMAVGNGLRTYSVGETALGNFNTAYTPAGGADNFNPLDRLLVVGMGTANNNRRDAMRILKNGFTGIGNGNPTTELHVRHGASAPNTIANGFKLQNEGANNNRWTFYVANSNGDLNLYFNDNGSAKGWFSSSTGAYNASSARHLKTNFSNLPTNTLHLVKQLNPLRYRYIHDSQGKYTYGFTVEEVLPLFAELIENTGENRAASGIHYAGFSVVAIKAIQELKAMEEELTGLMDRLEEQVKKISSKQ
jgi:hypothetical protein